MGQRRPTELPRTDRGRGRRRVDTTINYDAFTFEGCKKFSKRMAMQSNYNGSSSTKSESQKNNEISRRSQRGERIRNSDSHVFARQGRVAMPIV
jgi:hypothetical protein